MIHAVESKPVVVKGVIQQVNECKRLIASVIIRTYGGCENSSELTIAYGQRSPTDRVAQIAEVRWRCVANFDLRRMPHIVVYTRGLVRSHAPHRRGSGPAVDCRTASAWQAARAKSPTFAPELLVSAGVLLPRRFRSWRGCYFDFAVCNAGSDGLRLNVNLRIRCHSADNCCKIAISLIEARKVD